MSQIITGMAEKPAKQVVERCLCFPLLCVIAAVNSISAAKESVAEIDQTQK